MHALAACFQETRDGILRQPVDDEIGMQFSELAGDRDIAAAVAEADR
jgi:hypothetical protein